MKKAVNTDTRDLINNELKSQERNLSWLAKKTKISYPHLYFIFKRKERDLTEKNRNLINEVLKTTI